MKEKLDIFKGLHPGIVVGRELKKRRIPGGRFAIAINEYPQTMSAIIKGKRADIERIFQPYTCYFRYEKVQLHKNYLVIK